MRQLHVWRVKGEAAHGAGGGEEIQLYVTSSRTELPDVTEPKERCRHSECQHPKGHSWYLIDRIEYVGAVPADWIDEHSEAGEALKGLCSRKEDPTAS